VIAREFVVAEGREEDFKKVLGPMEYGLSFFADRLSTWEPIAGWKRKQSGGSGFWITGCRMKVLRIFAASINWSMRSSAG
jgi:hypothetical protein